MTVERGACDGDATSSPKRYCFRPIWFTARVKVCMKTQNRSRRNAPESTDALISVRWGKHASGV